MKNEIFNLLTPIGVAWKYLLNGLIGGFVWALYKKSPFWEAVRQIFIGGIVSAFVTPFIAEKTSINYAGFISFVLGMIGMVVIDIVYKWAINKIKLFFS